MAATSAMESTKAGRGRGQRGGRGRGRQASRTPVNQLSNMTYSIIKRPNKHKNIETTSKRSRYIWDENTRSTQLNSSALWIP